MQKNNIIRLLWICLLGILFGGQLKAQTYTLTVTTQEYQPLQGGQSLVNDIWDDPSFTIPLGFHFMFFNEDVQSWVLDPSFTFANLAAPPVDDQFSLLIPLGADLIDRGYLDSVHLSPIRYKVTGSTGQRVMTVEWSNAGYYQDLMINGVSTDYVNLQVRCYESNGDIEFHFGPNAVSDPALDFSGFPGPIVGMAEQYDPALDQVSGEVLLLSGDPTDPAVQTDYQNYTLGGPPPENTLYRFSRTPTGLFHMAEIASTPLFGPNPTAGNLQLLPAAQQETILQVDVIDLQGKSVLTLQGHQDITLNGLPAGVYELRVMTGSGIRWQRISLQATF